MVDLRAKGIARKAPVGFLQWDGGGLLGNDAVCTFREIGKLFVSQRVGDNGKTVAVEEGSGAVNGRPVKQVRGRAWYLQCCGAVDKYAI